MQKFFAQYPFENEAIAAGVSGGADSLALVLRLKDMGRQVTALTVDHGLRKESRAEAEYVADLMAQYGIEHHIISWLGQKPEADVEAAAREARYALLGEWCMAHGIRLLAVGHHRRDQAETFLLRLQRGSGVYGLSCMAPVTPRGKILILRPQLDESPEELKDYLRRRKIRWIEDPSNQCQDFQRARMRRFLPMLEREAGISEERLAETAKVLARTRNYLDATVTDRIDNQVRQWAENVFSFTAHRAAEWPEEIAFGIWGELLRRAGGRNYAPEAAEIVRLAQEAKRPLFKGCTLGGCEVLVAQKRLWIVPESRQGQVLSKTEWQKCLHFAPQYAKAGLPYKVRRALYNQFMQVANGKKN